MEDIFTMILYDLPAFQTSVTQSAQGEMWVSFRIQSGLFQNFVFFLTDLDKNDGFKYIYARLDEQLDGGELKNLDPTYHSSELAIKLAEYFRRHKDEIVDKQVKDPYNIAC